MKRYPGIRPFTTEDQLLFFGRKKEQRNLFRLAILNDIVILFGKSGTGKSSLLNAGVSPQFESNNLHPVFVRLNNTELSLEKQLYYFLLGNNYIPKDTPEGLTLWEYLKLFWYVDLGERFTPVIIVDQFEELFTLYKPEQRISSIEQFADVVNGRMPDSLRKKIKDPSVSLDKTIDWFTPPNVKFILSIRSDYLYLLNELSVFIPSILNNRFELGMLNRANAIQAITQPAEADGVYDSPVFKYDEEALNEIANVLGKKDSDQFRADLSDSELEIEAFQLQIFCQQIENKIIKDGKPKNFIVKSTYYGGKSGILKMIGEFYEGVIKKVPEQYKEAVQTMVATYLIRDKRRIIMAKSAIEEACNVPGEILEQLYEERLLRKENRAGIYYYEVSHDTLIKPILRKYQPIKARIEREEWKKKLKDQKIEITSQYVREQKDLRKVAENSAARAKRRTRFAIAAMIVAIILAGFAINFAIQKDIEKEKANKADNEALTEFRNAEEARAEAEKAQKEVEKTAEALNDALNAEISESDRNEKLAEINDKLQGEQKRKENPDTQPRENLDTLTKENQDLIKKLFSNSETIRRSAKMNLIRNYASNSMMISAILQESSNKINENYINNILQIIDYLGRCDDKALKESNKDKSVDNFIRSVRNAKDSKGVNLIGIATNTRLKRIEGKL